MASRVIPPWQVSPFSTLTGSVPSAVEAARTLDLPEAILPDADAEGVRQAISGAGRAFAHPFSCPAETFHILTQRNRLYLNWNSARCSYPAPSPRFTLSVLQAA
jgi:hypothetical protein